VSGRTCNSGAPRFLVAACRLAGLSSRKLAGFALHKSAIGRGEIMRRLVLTFAVLAVAEPVVAQEKPQSAFEALIATHAKANGVPEFLVHRVIAQESRYNPRAVGRGGTMGLMQIKHATARGVGYTGSASGLLDPETNLTYAVRYLAGAYRAAGGNADRAVSYFRSGYYRPKRKALSVTANAGEGKTSAQNDRAASARGEPKTPLGREAEASTLPRTGADFRP
jgi:soluble lytic murein transglycosylase-like protein